MAKKNTKVLDEEKMENNNAYDSIIAIPIQRIVQPDMVTVAIIKKYIALSFEKNEKYAVVPDEMHRNRDDWNNFHQFQGYLSASFCFLNLIDKLIGTGEWKESDSAEGLLTLVGTYNKNVRLRWQKTDTRIQDQKILDEEVFNIDLSKGVPMPIQLLFNNFCPPAQDDGFYSSWALFCSELYAMILLSTKTTKKYFTLQRIQYVVLNIVDDVLEQLMDQLCGAGDLFGWYFPFCLMQQDLNIADKEDIELCEKAGSFLLPGALEDLKKEKFYIDSLEKTRQLLSSIKNKDLAIQIARNLVIAGNYIEVVDWKAFP